MKLQEARLERKRQREKEIISDMIRIHCQGNHSQPCRACEELLAYALKRTDQCPHMETKSFCSVCKTQCYTPAYREAIRQAMRYSGRRYVLIHPIRTLAHGWVTLRARQRQIRQSRKALSQED